MKIAFDWMASSFFGWGVYGINLALELSRRRIDVMSTYAVCNTQVILDSVRLEVLKDFIDRSNMQQPVPQDYVLLHALGNEILPEREDARVGVIFFEQTPLSPAAVERAKRYDVIITGSTWNKEVLRARGLTNVRTVIQGVDRSIFHPAPRRDVYPGRFLIFSGGKAELRKGQDIVVKAFRIFARKHPEAILVTAWHSPFPHLAAGMDLDLSEFKDRIIDVGPVPNGQMAPVYRDCHVGLFPSRSEGGTNLVAMEMIACGLPAIISDCTGHRDLVRLAPQSVRAVPVAQGPRYYEPDLDAVLDRLEAAFNGDNATGPDDLPGWDHTAEGLLEVARQISPS
jgi:glycosyltransferase involved in cell wall biosynthesis